MMRDFTKISPVLWRSKRFLRLSTEARLAYLYLLTSKHQTTAGAYQLPPAYGAQDLGWVVDDFDAALQQLEELKLILRDKSTNELMITDWYKHNGPANPSHRLGIVRCINQLESNELREASFQELNVVSPEPSADVHKLLSTKGLGKSFGNRSS